MTLSQSTFQSKNPITGELLWEGSAASEKEIDRAVREARKSLEEWSSLSLPQREKYLGCFKIALESKKEFFAEAISKETGKPLWESKTEVDSMSAKVDISIEAQKLRCPETVKPLPGATSITRHRPLGVLAVLGPYNFPGHLPNGHIVPALLAGNTVVFKPSEQTPFVGAEMVRIWHQSGLPQGVLNLVQGGATVGKALSQHPDINGLLFTGSWKTGKMLAEHFGKHPEKLLALEMGGNNPLLIGKVSNYEAASVLIIQSAFLTAGQRCTCARRLIVPKGKPGDDLLKTFLDIASHVRIGAYTDTPEPFMGPVIDLHASKNLLSTQNAMRSMGGKVLMEMKELRTNTPLLSPAVIDVTAMTVRADEEYFGPLLQVIRVDSFEDAIKEANNTSFGLCAGILTEDKSEYDAYFASSRAGVVNWNSQTTGASSRSPFGGVGKSGNFRPSAYYAADYCNYPVASIESSQLKMPDKLPPGLKEASKRS